MPSCDTGRSCDSLFGFCFCTVDNHQHLVRPTIQSLPIYVGACYLKDYLRFRFSAFFIETHIISDVYLVMLFAMISKLETELCGSGR